MNENQDQLVVGTRALLEGQGDRVWEIEDIGTVEDGTTRYLVNNLEPNTSGGMFGPHYQTTRKLVPREKLVVFKPLSSLDVSQPIKTPSAREDADTSPAGAGKAQDPTAPGTASRGTRMADG